MNPRTQSKYDLCLELSQLIILVCSCANFHSLLCCMPSLSCQISLPQPPVLAFLIHIISRSIPNLPSQIKSLEMSDNSVHTSKSVLWPVISPSLQEEVPCFPQAQFCHVKFCKYINTANKAVLKILQITTTKNKPWPHWIPNNCAPVSPMKVFLRVALLNACMLPSSLLEDWNRQSENSE